MWVVWLKGLEIEAVEGNKVVIIKVILSYDKDTREWLTLLAYMKKKYKCIWCEDGKL